MAIILDLLNKDTRPRHPEKAHRPDQPVQRKPDWIRVRAPGSPKWAETNRIVRENKLVTVCEEAGCPNIGECWEKKHATFMIMGDTCTRACAFCNVKTGLPEALDPQEPAKVAMAVREMGLKHVVITSVDRDDLADGGAEHFAAVVRAIRAEAPGTRYYHSLRLLERVKERDPLQFTKSGLMVGLGETKEEVMQVMDDMRSAGVDFITIGQYLQPTRKHAPIDRYWSPDEFKALESIAWAKGFLMVS